LYLYVFTFTLTLLLSLSLPGLFSVTIRQALFIAPCSHTFHYKCLRPILQAHHPSFTCPICRTYADLDEDVELDDDHLQPDITHPEIDQPAQLDPAVESVLNAVGAISGVGGVLDLDDDPMDIDVHGRGDVTGESFPLGFTLSSQLTVLRRRRYNT